MKEHRKQKKLLKRKRKAKKKTWLNSGTSGIQRQALREFWGNKLKENKNG